MQQAMVRCNGVQTHVVTEGRWIEEGLDPNGKKDLVVVIPGNPGIPSFYEGFIKALKSKLPSETPVWVVGHAGHVQPPDDLWFSKDDETQNDKYNLDGQLKHKIEFLKQFAPKDARIHLIGHSIGSWFTLKILDDANYADQIHKCYLLFPTIERMAESPSGKSLTGRVFPILPLLTFFAWIFSFLPTVLQTFLIRTLGGFFTGVQSKSVKAVIQFINPSVMSRVFGLAKEELKRVKELDHDAIDRHGNKLWLYYGSRDGWTPKRYYDEFRANHPNVTAELCTQGFRHAFVLTNDKEMGHIVGEMINSTIT